MEGENIRKAAELSTGLIAIGDVVTTVQEGLQGTKGFGSKKDDRFD